MKLICADFMNGNKKNPNPKNDFGIWIDIIDMIVIVETHCSASLQRYVVKFIPPN
jgi:hypothetical protein